MIMLPFCYPLFLNRITYSASRGKETKLDKNMVDCEPHFIRYYNQYLIFVLLKNLNTMSYLKNWFQSCKEETNFDNGLLCSRFVHVHTICSHFFKIKIIFSVHVREPGKPKTMNQSVKVNES